MTEEFRVRDVVRLVSGSPAMTVCAVQEKEIEVQWFYNGELRSGLIRKDVLEKTGAPDRQRYQG